MNQLTNDDMHRILDGWEEDVTFAQLFAEVIAGFEAQVSDQLAGPLDEGRVAAQKARLDALASRAAELSPEIAEAFGFDAFVSLVLGFALAITVARTTRLTSAQKDAIVQRWGVTLP